MSRSDSESSDENSHVEESIANDTIYNKYQVAGEISNNALKEVISKICVGANVFDLCCLGDKIIQESTSKVFKKDKDLIKGISMPTCISIDNIVCHFSPLKSEEPVVLQEGQVVKIDIGAHIDGYIAYAAHTVVVGSNENNKVTGKKADLIKGCYEALEVAVKSLRIGKSNFEIAANIEKAAKCYGVVPVEGIVSNQVLRNNNTDGKKIVQNSFDIKQHKQSFIKEYEVYSLDIIFTTGNGKTKKSDARSTVYRSTVPAKNETVQGVLFRMFVEIWFDDILSSVFRRRENGIKFCNIKFEFRQDLELLSARDTNVTDNSGEFVAQFKATVMVTPTGLTKISGLPFECKHYETDKCINDPELALILKSGMKHTKPKKSAAAAKASEIDKGSMPDA